MMFGGGMKEGWKLSQYYVQSGAGGDGGGFAGGALVMILSSALGSVGTYLVLIVALVLGAVCITEKSLVSLVKKGSGRAYEYAREDMNRRREIHEERREERRRMREEQRVRGVDLDATNLNDVPLMREFAAGIPEGTVLAEDRNSRKTTGSSRQMGKTGKRPPDVSRILPIYSAGVLPCLSMIPRRTWKRQRRQDRLRQKLLPLMKPVKGERAGKAVRRRIRMIS